MWMESQYKCLECNLLISDKNYAISRHVKKHDLTFYEYIKKKYKLTNGKFEKCGFCENESIPTYKIDHLQKTYSISHDSGYFCRTLECKNNISIEILGEEYNPKKFEKIGSKSEYLSKLYKINLNDAKNKKFDSDRIDFFNNSLDSFIEKYGELEGDVRYNKRIEGITKNNPKNKFPCSLENFIKKYGEEIGTKKYNDRCEKISYTSSKDYFITKYGELEGNKIWKNKYKLNRISNKSKILSKILNQLDIRFETEKNISSKFVDYFLTDYNIVIEYFGDYWHGNPKKFKSDFYISQLKMNVGELWIKDKERLEKINQSIDSIIVIWESSNIDLSILEKTINEIKNKKTIIYL